MKKTLMLALALGVLAGCADDSADVVDTDTTVIEPAAPVTEPIDDIEDDSMLMDEPMMDETLEGDAMEGDAMEGDAMEGDAGMDETDEMMEEDAL